ncbi:MAG: DUF3796 domain-containing protein [Lachnospiraceae bacterium]|nr:DUF3796 domain-containing protein [Lachnospiraceae bacterium]
MKKSRKKLTIIFGVICTLFIAVSSWYTITYNESRILKPMNWSDYVFRTQDLPMISSVILFILYLLYLVMPMRTAILPDRRREAASQSARTVNPKLGLLGLSGFAGFLGFWTYRMDKSIFPFVFFMFFGFFGFFYEGKMSNTFQDERYMENKIKAQLTANKTALIIIFIATLILGQGKLMGNLEYTLIALVIVMALSLALELFLQEYLLYRYDNDEQFNESEE